MKSNDIPPDEIQKIAAKRAMTTMGVINGVQIAILASDVEHLEMAWARLCPNVSFLKEKCQPVVVLLLKDLV